MKPVSRRLGFNALKKKRGEVAEDARPEGEASGEVRELVKASTECENGEQWAK